MPFTAAHPAIVLPFKHFFKRYFSTTGLVVGSIAPDFAYFINPVYSTKISHTLKGVLYFNLPVAIILALLFHVIVREQLIQFLPHYLKSRAIVMAKASWFAYMRRNWHLFLASAILGALSHIFWDGFTHYSGWFVRHIPLLRLRVDFLNYPMPICRWLQHTSTIVGLTTIAFYVRQLPSYQINESRKYGWVYFWLSVIAFGLILVIVTKPEVRSITQVELWVVRFLSGCLLAVVLLTAFFKFRRSMAGTLNSE